MDSKPFTSPLWRAVWVAACVMISAPVYAASIAGPRRSALERLEEGDAIRRRMLLRGGRFELTPTVGFTLNDAFRRNMLVGANMAYHFNDAVALGANVMGGFGFNTGLADEVSSQRADRVDGFSDQGLLGSVELVYTPLIGKFALFGRSIVNYDIHILLGGGASIRGGDSADVENLSPMAVAGIGLRTFVGDWMAVNIEVRDYIYSAKLNAVAGAADDGGTAAQSEVSNNFAVTMGFGFFFPQEPKLSE